MPTTSSAPATTVTPVRQAGRVRPPWQYWDFRSAGWQTVSAIPQPRRGQ